MGTITRKNSGSRDTVCPHGRGFKKSWDFLANENDENEAAGLLRKKKNP